MTRQQGIGSLTLKGLEIINHLLTVGGALELKKFYLSEKAEFMSTVVNPDSSYNGLTLPNISSSILLFI
jgi:hypothetical protein